VLINLHEFFLGEFGDDQFLPGANAVWIFSHPTISVIVYMGISGFLIEDCTQKRAVAVLSWFVSVDRDVQCQNRLLSRSPCPRYRNTFPKLIYESVLDDAPDALSILRRNCVDIESPFF